METLRQSIETPDVRIASKEELYETYMKKDLNPQDNGISVAINMVSSIDGVINIKQPEGVGGGEQGLGHPIDQDLMRYLRFHADATLNGMETLLASGSDADIDEEKYPHLIEARRKLGKGDNPFACVVTSDPDPERLTQEKLKGQFFTNPKFRSVLFVGENAPEEHLERVRKAIPSGKEFEIVKLPLDKNGKPDIKALVKTLHEKYSVKVLLSEGGPSLNGSLVESGLANHLFLTRSPRIAIADRDRKGPITGPHTLTRDELVHTQLVSQIYNSESEMTFEHHRILPHD